MLITINITITNLIHKHCVFLMFSMMSIDNALYYEANDISSYAFLYCCDYHSLHSNVYDQDKS